MRTLAAFALIFAATSALLYIWGGEARPYFVFPIYPAAVCAIAWFSGRFWKFPR
jgi:hypothetical protein